MLRQLLRPLRAAQPALLRPFSLSAVARLPAAKVSKTTKPRAVGSGQGGAADKTAALQAKLAKATANAAALKQKLKDSEKAKGKASTAGRKKIAATKKKDAKAKGPPRSVQRDRPFSHCCFPAATKTKAKAVKAKAKKAAVVKKPRVSHVIKAPKAPSNTWQLYLADYISVRPVLLHARPTTR